MLFGADCRYIGAMPTLIAGVVAVVRLYLLLQMFRAANPVRARARDQDRLRRRGLGGRRLHRAPWRARRRIPLGIFGAGLLGWSPFGPGGFSNIGGLFGAAGAATRQDRPRECARSFST